MLLSYGFNSRVILQNFISNMLNCVNIYGIHLTISYGHHVGIINDRRPKIFHDVLIFSITLTKFEEYPFKYSY